jgi:hypothetical protein
MTRRKALPGGDVARASKGLRSSTGITVSIKGMAPSVGDVLKATSATEAEFAAPTGGGGSVNSVGATAPMSNTGTASDPVIAIAPDAFEVPGTASSLLAAHVAAADPHLGYQKESEKAAVNGYASLDGSTRIPTGQIPPITLAMMDNLAQDQFIGRTTASTGVPQTATITAAARTVLDDTTVAAMRATLGLGAASTFGDGDIALIAFEFGA